MLSKNRGLLALTPVLALLAVIAAIVTPASAPAASTVSDPAYRTVAARTLASQPTTAKTVLGWINSERKKRGVKPVTMDKRLVAAAHKHNVRMAYAKTMSHQLRGEAGLGKRISAEKVRWTYCAENIGWSSDTSNRGVAASQTVHRAMMSEGPPPRGQINHYSNILSKNVNKVGVDVLYDSQNHRYWLTEDFAKA